MHCFEENEYKERLKYVQRICSSTLRISKKLLYDILERNDLNLPCEESPFSFFKKCHDTTQTLRVLSKTEPNHGLPKPFHP